MSIFFLILVALAGFHFFYEGVIAPSLRFELRLKLFALRDEIRELKLKYGDELGDEVFRYLQSSINATIGRLSLIDLRLLIRAHEAFEHDEKLSARAERVERMLRECPIAEVQEIRTRQLQLVGYALAVNSGGWSPYLIPVVIGKLSARSAKAQVRRVFELPENDINKIVPDPLVWAT